MSILASITSGVTRSGLRAVIAGPEKIGKTTLTTGAPKALLVPLEVGFGSVSVAKTPMLQSYEELVQFLAETTHFAKLGQFPYQSIVFDSVTAMERGIHDYVLRSDPAYRAGAKKTVTMESAHGGYGKAYNLANDYFGMLLQQFDQLAVHAGLNIILTAHTFASKVVDPAAGEYDSWDLLLHSPKNQKTYGKREMLTQWADLIGFLYEPLFVNAGDGKGMARAMSQNKGRVLGVTRTPSYVAGNRFGIMGELSMPVPPHNGWNALAHALYQASGVDVYTR